MINKNLFSFLYQQPQEKKSSSCFIALTFNYTIKNANSFEKELLKKAENFSLFCTLNNCIATFFIDTFLYQTLQNKAPEKALLFEKQILEFIQQGHNIQLLLHNNISDNQKELNNAFSLFKTITSKNPEFAQTVQKKLNYQSVQLLKQHSVIITSLFEQKDQYCKPYFANTYNTDYQSPSGEKFLLKIPTIKSIESINRIIKKDNCSYFFMLEQNNNKSENIQYYTNNSNFIFVDLPTLYNQYNNQNHKTPETYQHYIKNQINKNCEAVMGEQRNWEQSMYAQNKIPATCKNILDLGCGSGYWTDLLNNTIATTVGVDVAESFVTKAQQKYPHLHFEVMDFHNLTFEPATFDCVYADNVLEHALFPNKVFEEIFKILKNNGILIALIPPDARNPKASSCCHTWKTDFDDIKQRLHDTGFTHVIIEDINTKKMGMADYAPSNNSMLLIKAYKNYSK